MSSEPPCVTPVPWWKSQRFIALVQSSVLFTGGWLYLTGLADFSSWKTGLLLPLLGNVIVWLKDMWSPSVMAPAFVAKLGANKSNVEIAAFKKPGDV